MTVEQAPHARPELPPVTHEALLLQRSVEQFYALEAELLDDHRYRDWLSLLADDIVYTAPVRTSRRSDGRMDDAQMLWFDDLRPTLELRVRRLETDVNWAEEPPSRTRRIVGSVRIEPVEGTEDVLVRSNLLMTRNRREHPAADVIAAERHDLLRGPGPEWRLGRRTILFDHGTLPTKNLALLF